jgi:hypothetical protein
MTGDNTQIRKALMELLRRCDRLQRRVEELSAQPEHGGPDQDRDPLPSVECRRQRRAGGVKVGGC